MDDGNFIVQRLDDERGWVDGPRFYDGQKAMRFITHHAEKPGTYRVVQARSNTITVSK